MDTTHLTQGFTTSIKRVPSRLKMLYRSLSPERVIVFWMCICLALALLFAALISYNARFLLTIPSYGGTISEGIVGTPRFINPVLATSEQDEDLTSLIYAGLTKKDTNGNTVLDMAESITQSEEGLRYTVILKPTVKFHDGTNVTVDDIIYTVNLIQNPNIKSPHRIEWEGISIQKISDKELIFSLKKPYPVFMDILTIGIIPKNIWKNLTDEQFSLSDYNIRAIGSGPYAIKTIKSTSGIPYQFILEAHEQYTLGRPYIDTITITTYQSERYALQAFTNGNINRIHGISPNEVGTLDVLPSQIHTSLLPRTFTVFFNPNKYSALSEKKVRQALLFAIDKDAIVEKVLHNYGKTLTTPFPFDEEFASSTYNVEEARVLLSESKSGSKGALSITLATANTDEMRAVADMIKANWEAVGVETTLAVYEVSDLNQSVIKDRNFEALLFGSITETPADLYAFWHSSQRSYPGLNISGYVSNKLDTSLEVLRNSNDQAKRGDAYEEVKQEFKDEIPGIFLFAPSLIYLTKDKAITLMPEVSYSNASRFTLVERWYRYSERVWPKTYYKQFLQAIENSIH